MLRNIYAKSLNDQRRSLMFWAIGIAALSLITVLFYPAFKDAPEFSELLEDSEVLVNLFAGGFTDFTTPEGYLNSQVYALLVPILFFLFAIAQGAGAIAGEEERGTLDILLSNPTTRVQVLIQKFAAMATAILALAFVLWLSMVIGAALVSMDVSALRLAAITVSGALLGITFGALSLALGCATGKRGLSIGVAGAIAVTSYFVYSLVPLVEGIEQASKLSPFHYYITADPLSNGLNLVHAGALVGLAVALVAIAILTFERRDLAV